MFMGMVRGREDWGRDERVCSPAQPVWRICQRSSHLLFARTPRTPRSASRPCSCPPSWPAPSPTVLHHRLPGHHAVVPPPAEPPLLHHAQVAGVRVCLLRRHGGAGRPPGVGECALALARACLTPCCRPYLRLPQQARTRACCPSRGVPFATQHGTRPAAGWGATLAPLDHHRRSRPPLVAAACLPPLRCRATGTTTCTARLPWTRTRCTRASGGPTWAGCWTIAPRSSACSTPPMRRVRAGPARRARAGRAAGCLAPRRSPVGFKGAPAQLHSVHALCWTAPQHPSA